MASSPKTGSKRVNLQDELANCEKKFGGRSAEYLRIRLHIWIANCVDDGTLATNGKGQGTRKGFLDQIRKLLTERGHKSPPKSFLNRNTYYRENLFTLHWVWPILDAIPDTREFEENRRLAASWRTWASGLAPSEMRYRHHISRDGNPTPFTESPLKGDYLVARRNIEGQTTLSFLRCYEHKSGASRVLTLHGKRGVKITRAKGFLTRQHDAAMLSMWVMESGDSGKTWRNNGGLSAFSVWVNPTKHRIVHDSLGTIVAAPALHWDAVNQIPSSLAPAMIVRLCGAEKFASNANTASVHERNKGLWDLQEKLRRLLGRPIDDDRWNDLMASHFSGGSSGFRAFNCRAISDGRNAHQPISLERMLDRTRFELHCEHPDKFRLSVERYCSALFGRK